MTSKNEQQHSTQKKISVRVLESLKVALNWLFSDFPPAHSAGAAPERLLLTMQTTAAARYQSSVRLRYNNKTCFVTSTIFSLGLILISLLQLADVCLYFDDRVLTAMTVFLAVSVLIYSVAATMAHYEVRAEQLNECGDKIKHLIRELQREIQYSGASAITKEKMQQIEEKYNLIVTDTEPHTRNDYRRTVLDFKKDYKITGLTRLKQSIIYYLFRSLDYIPHGAFLAIQFIFISDMFGSTDIFEPLLGVNKNCPRPK